MMKIQRFTSTQVDSFLGLPKGSFDHIPNYAKQAALSAIAKVRKLEQEHIFRPGLYYIALIDLTASTGASKSLGTDLNQKRVQTFVTACVESLGMMELTSYAQFVKEIGDATLFIFSSFEDLVFWWQQAEEQFWSYNQEWENELCGDEKFDDFIIRAKTVVHLGEVSYITPGNPLSLAVNQVFKIEKLFQPHQLGCTEAVRLAAGPLFNKHKINPKAGKKVILPGEKVKTPTWILKTSPWADYQYDS